MRQSLTSRLILRLLPLAPLALLVGPFAGCSDPAPPIDPAALAEQAALHAREVVHHARGVRLRLPRQRWPTRTPATCCTPSASVSSRATC